MRIQISIPPELWERLCALAHAAHRFPKQQAEYLLACALRPEGSTASLGGDQLLVPSKLQETAHGHV